MSRGGTNNQGRFVAGKIGNGWLRSEGEKGTMQMEERVCRCNATEKGGMSERNDRSNAEWRKIEIPASGRCEKSQTACRKVWR